MFWPWNCLDLQTFMANYMTHCDATKVSKQFDFGFCVKVNRLKLTYTSTKRSIYSGFRFTVRTLKSVDTCMSHTIFSGINDALISVYFGLKVKTHGYSYLAINSKPRHELFRESYHSVWNDDEKIKIYFALIFTIFFRKNWILLIWISDSGSRPTRYSYLAIKSKRRHELFRESYRSVWNDENILICVTHIFTPFFRKNLILSISDSRSRLAAAILP